MFDCFGFVSSGKTLKVYIYYNNTVIIGTSYITIMVLTCTLHIIRFLYCKLCYILSVQKNESISLEWLQNIVENLFIFCCFSFSFTASVSKKRQVKYKRISALQYLYFYSEKRAQHKIFHIHHVFFSSADHDIIIDVYPQ